MARQEVEQMHDEPTRDGRFWLFPNGRRIPVVSGGDFTATDVSAYNAAAVSASVVADAWLEPQALTAAIGQGAQPVPAFADQSTRIVVDLPAETLAALVAAGSDHVALAEVELPIGEIPWRAEPIMLSDSWTSDGRQFLSAGGSHRDLPLPLMANLETTYGHDGARLIGRIESIELGSPNITAAGMFADSDLAREVVRHLVAGNLRGISTDLTNVDVDIECVEDDEGFLECTLSFTQWTIMGATVTPFPAFEDTQVVVELDAAPADDEEPAPDDDQENATPALTLAASGAPVDPPAAWFDDPLLTGPTPLTVGDDGRVFGHVATWQDCHLGFSDVCVCAPHSNSGYAYFLTGEIRCADGSRRPVGQLTMGTGHADQSLDARATLSHYDDTGTAAADVNIGEDAHGIWIAGACRPRLSDEQRRELCAAVPSGDWRRIALNLELVAVLQVNMGGYTIPRVRVASGAMQTLVASIGGHTLARQAEHDRTPVPRSEYDELLARVERLSGTVHALESGLGPQARAGLRSQLEPV